MGNTGRYRRSHSCTLKQPLWEVAVESIPDLHELARNVVLADYRPFPDSIQIVKEKHDGKDAVIAVAFETRDGAQRRGLVGMCSHHGSAWRASGAFMGSARPVDDRQVWMTWGGWGPADSDEPAVIGGWVADTAARSARAVDPAGAVLDDVVENGVVIFLHRGSFDPGRARLELLDAQGRVLRAEPIHKNR